MDRWRGSARGNARLISRLGASRRLIGWFGANDRLIGQLMPHSPRTGRWRGSADELSEKPKRKTEKNRKVPGTDCWGDQCLAAIIRGVR
jgi:hypothetical protein